MTFVSLTTQGITFTFAQGEVNKVVESISSGAENTEVPAAGPMSSYNYDYEGVKKIITINGVLFETDTSRTSSGTISTILAQKQWLESLVNGNQGSISFTSNYSSQSVLNNLDPVSPYISSFTSTLVMIDSINFTENESRPEELTFMITFKVGRP